MFLHCFVCFGKLSQVASLNEYFVQAPHYWMSQQVVDSTHSEAVKYFVEGLLRHTGRGLRPEFLPKSRVDHKGHDLGQLFIINLILAQMCCVPGSEIPYED